MDTEIEIPVNRTLNNPTCCASVRSRSHQPDGRKENHANQYNDRT